MPSTAAFAFGPTTSGSAANFTSWPSSSERRTATGANDNSGFGSPFGLPRWEQRITLPPSPINFLIVGSAATRRFSSVIFPSFNGTLKSQRTRTFFPFTLISSTDFLFSMEDTPFLTERVYRLLKTKTGPVLWTGPMLNPYSYFSHLCQKAAML